MKVCQAFGKAGCSGVQCPKEQCSNNGKEVQHTASCEGGAKCDEGATCEGGKCMCTWCWNHSL